MKKLYMIAGESGGYVNIKFSFNYEAVQKEMNDKEELYGATDSFTYINVPDDATYESLGITYPIEDDQDEEFDE